MLGQPPTAAGPAPGAPLPACRRPDLGAGTAISSRPKALKNRRRFVTDPAEPILSSAAADPAIEPGGGDFDAVLTGLKSAGEPTRLRLLVLCGQSELTVSDLTQILGQSQPRVSRHLKLLTDAGLLERYREGTFALFRLAAGGPAARAVRAAMAELSGDDPLLRRDRERLAAIKQERAQRAARYFEANAERWDHLRTLHVAESAVERAMAALVAREPAEALLDIGTGTGRSLQVLAPLVGRAVGVDLSRQMLAVARANLERAGLADCQVRHGDLYHLPFPDAAFDLAVVHQVLHFLEDPLDALREAARVLRPGGRLVIADLAPHDLLSLRRDHAHRWLGLPLDALERWLGEAGLVPEERRLLPGNPPGEPLTVLLALARKPAVPGRGGFAKPDRGG